MAPPMPWDNPAMPLVMLDERQALLTLSQAYESIFTCGDTGSGKTSGTGALLSRALLHAGFGFLILTAKKEERAWWERLATETNRAQDVRVFSPESGAEFNFLAYELTRSGAGAFDVENLVDLFFNVLEATGKQSGSSREDPFWTHSFKQLLRNAIDLVYAATGTVGLQEIKDVIKSAPQSREEARSDTWTETSFCYQLIEQAEKKQRTEQQQRDYDESVDFWLETFPALSEKTRSIITLQFSSTADYFLRGRLHSLFCKGTNIRPEDAQAGKIIILDLPVLEYGERGRFAQLVFKYIFQKSIQRRDISQSPRPVAIWQDEGQLFLLPTADAHFQATARSSRACTVFLTQNLPNLYKSLGGNEGAKWEAQAILANLKTKFFHANSDPETNNFAAELIGKEWSARVSTNLNSTPTDTMGALFGQSQQGSSVGTSESLEYEYLPNDFKKLRTGGHQNQGAIDVVVLQSGRRWPNGKNYLPLTLRQEGF